MTLFSDWGANKRNPKGRLVLLMFRLASWFSRAPRYCLVLGVPYVVFYRLTVEWLLGVELPWRLQMGEGARVFHGMALVVNDHAVIGRRVVLRHSTTIGVSETDAGVIAAPVIGDDVDIGAHVVIIGAVTIGDRAVIGAGAVVVRDVPPGAVVVGNPARVIRYVDGMPPA
jgi:putative colanic acid biosynthesis acetyltransferase WcaB